MLDEIEKVLLTADIGVRTSQKLLEEMRASLSRKELNDVRLGVGLPAKRSAQSWPLDAPPLRWSRRKPFVLLVIGVNGSGKTTTIGKLAAQLIADGKKVLLGAGDTFRAAATEQLEIWANRAGATLVRGKEGADPSSVIFDAVKTRHGRGLRRRHRRHRGPPAHQDRSDGGVAEGAARDRQGRPGRPARDLAGDRLHQRAERDRPGADLHAGDGGFGYRADEAGRHRQGRRHPRHRRSVADSRCASSASASGSRTCGNSIAEEFVEALFRP